MTTRRSNDPQAWVRDRVTDEEGGVLDFDPVVTCGSTEVPAEWVSAVDTTRVLRFNVTGLPALLHTPWLSNPNGEDLQLQPVNVVP